MLSEYPPGPAPVLSISACECVDGRGEVVAVEEAVGRIAEVAWSAPAPRFLVVHAVVYRSAEDPDQLRAVGRSFPVELLAARWGPRPPELVRIDRADDVIWMFLPIAWIVHLAVIVWVVAAIARRGWIGVIFVRT